MQREILKNFIDRSTVGGKKSKDGSGSLHTTQLMTDHDEEHDQMIAKRLFGSARLPTNIASSENSLLIEATAQGLFPRAPLVMRVVTGHQPK